MDTFDLFRKLSTGAKFDLKRFRDDAVKLKIIKNKDQKGELLQPSTSKDDEMAKSTTSSGEKRQIKEDDEIVKKQKISDSENSSSDDDEEEVQSTDTKTELRLLGEITSSEKQIKVDLAPEEKAQIEEEKVREFRKQNKIHVWGTDVPEPLSNFDQMSTDNRMHPALVKNIESMEYTNPTPIQMQAIPILLQRRELLACAPTGSGKTAAFLIPIIHHLKDPRHKGFRAVIVEPTRELARQVYWDCCRLSEGRGFKVQLVDKVKKSSKHSGQTSTKKVDILITTPQRLVFLLSENPPALNLTNVEWLIIDESDKLFEEGSQRRSFREQLAIIYKACDSSKVRRAMFSATYTPEVEEWCNLNLDNLLTVYIGAKNSAVETIEQQLEFVGNEHGKLFAIRNLIRQGITPPVLIFVQSKERAKALFNELVYDGINVDVIHSDRSQLQRETVVKGFRGGKVWVLICTELLGRGIDFKGVNLVINYDMPGSAISYIHRIGRTGRAGRKGKAVTFFTEKDKLILRDIAEIMKDSGCEVPEYMLKLERTKRKSVKINREAVSDVTQDVIVEQK